MDLYIMELKCEPEVIVKFEPLFTEHSYDATVNNDNLVATECESVSSNSSTCGSLNGDIIKQECKCSFCMTKQLATCQPTTTISASVKPEFNQDPPLTEHRHENTGNLSVTSNCTNKYLSIDTTTQNEDSKVVDFDGTDFDVQTLNSIKVESEEELETDSQSNLKMSMENKRKPYVNSIKEDRISSGSVVCKKELKVVLTDVLVDYQSNSKIALKKLKDNMRQTESTNSNNRSTKDSASGKEIRKPKTRTKTQHNCPYCNRNFTRKDLFSIHLSRKHSKKNPDFLVEKFDKTDFTCDICKFRSSCSHSFKSHMLIHERVVNTNMLKCKNCNYETFHKSNLRVHIQKKHSTYSCRFCNKTIFNKPSLADHLLTSHDDKFEKSLKKLLSLPIKHCNLCDFRVHSKEKLNEHIQSKHSADTPANTCRFCNKRLCSKPSLADHLLCQHGEKFDKAAITILSQTIKHCNLCDYRTISNIKLNNHMTKHLVKAGTDSIIFRCNNCDYETLQKSYLRGHSRRMHSNTDAIIFKCHDCAYETFQKCYLRDHIRRKHSNCDRRMYTCRFCKKTFLKKASLADHLLSHHGEKFDKSLKTLLSQTIKHCKLCDFRTTTKFVLLNHMTTKHDHSVKQAVTNKIIFKCNNCDFETFLKCHLRTHIQKKHSNDRPTYSCRFCNKTLYSKVSLVDHLLCHHGDKFKKSLKKLLSLTIKHCNLCDFRVNAKNKLIQHIQRKHSNDRPTYTCRFCNKTMINKVGLAEHLLLYHSDKLDNSLKTLFSLTINHCNLCDFRAISKAKLNRHIKKHDDIPV